jgi:RNA recognition motif-containing protein
MPKRVGRGDGSYSRGVGFIMYTKAEAAQRAIEAKNQTELHGKFIQVKIALRPSSLKRRNTNNQWCSRYDQQGRKLHIANLPVNKERQLKEMFEEFGVVEECYIPLDGNSPKGYGFVTFKDARDADAALRHWDGKIFRGRRLACQKAKPPVSRRPGFHRRRRTRW